MLMVNIPHIDKGVKLTVFSLPHCPNCEELKDTLDELGFEYDVLMMDTAEGITELRANGCFAMQAPVLRIGDEFVEF